MQVSRKAAHPFRASTSKLLRRQAAPVGGCIDPEANYVQQHFAYAESATRARIAGHVLVQDTGGEAVLLDLAGERYFGLNKVGTRIWQLLGETSSLEDIQSRLCTEFDASSERIRQDLVTLLGQLSAAGLITME